ncbi:MAG: hypothetical protein MR940_04210 [Lachnospiraceae bacterium]|nr:hypothetical protein [Lachnospiraceae bacterium]
MQDQRNRHVESSVVHLISVFIFLSFLTVMIQNVHASASEISIKSENYLFKGKSEYIMKEAKKKNTDTISSLGKLIVSGAVEQNGNEDGFEKLNVSDGELKIAYRYTEDDDASDAEWRVIKDGTSSINGEELDDEIGHGAILIQTSFDGKRWINSKNQTDYLTKNREKPIFTASEFQLLNGCYFRIIVAYKEEKVTGSKKIFFANVDEKENRKVAEVYQFYAVNEEAKSKEVSSIDKAPRQVYEDKALVTNAGKDTGYSEKHKLTEKDVHYGWGIGTFTVNGYTQTQEDDGKTVFLKNVGDQVTLWFSLDQNIEKLNGNNNLAISNDKNGSDQGFQVKKTNMKRGALIIVYTDPQNHQHDPVIYTDFLAACSTTSADTRVVLNEEGDYKVALDYEIKDTPKLIGPVGGIPTYSNYRTSFEFSVHNSNAMVYPFDVLTGSELQNRSVTPNGFRIDLANSKDLDVFVTQSKVYVNSDGKHVEDSRGTKASKDGAEYTKEGIYSIKVENTYTKQETTKIIFVGEDPFLKALAGTGLSVKELDEALAQGYKLKGDGTVVATRHSQTTADKALAEKITTSNENISEQKSKKKDSFPISPIVVVAVLIVVSWIGYRKRAVKTDSIDKDSSRTKQSDIGGEDK